MKMVRASRAYGQCPSAGNNGRERASAAAGCLESGFEGVRRKDNGWRLESVVLESEK